MVPHHHTGMRVSSLSSAVGGALSCRGQCQGNACHARCQINGDTSMRFLEMKTLWKDGRYTSKGKKRKEKCCKHYMIPRHCAYLCCCTCFGIKKYQCDQIHQLFHKIFSINILKPIKGHNSVEKFGKIMCISNNMDHIYQCINKILSRSIHYF